MDYSQFSHYSLQNLWRGICVIKLDLKLVNFSKSNQYYKHIIDH